MATPIAMITGQDAHATYKALGQLGEGAFSEVFRVENKKTNKISAMKRFKKRFETYQHHFPRFRAQLESVRQMRTDVLIAMQ